MVDHRVERRGLRPTAPAALGGRHLAPPAPVEGRTPSPLRRRAAAVPSVLGAALLAVAATGAVQHDSSTTVGLPLQASVAAASAGGPLVDGLGVSGQAIVADLDKRELAISRDSARQALQEAADAELQAAVDEDAAERNARLRSLAQATEQRAGEIQLNRWVLPTSNYRLTGRFGASGRMWSSTHTGLDFAAPIGTPVVSVAAGTVTATGAAGPYGNRVVVTHPDGTEVWYCHLTAINVQPGQAVAGAQQVGTVGSTGNSTGPHLHLEVRPGGGDPVDPFQALVVRGLQP